MLKKIKPASEPKQSYRISMVSVSQDGSDYISVSGRIEGGGRSKIFEGKDYVFGHAKDEWKMSTVHFTCVSD